MSQFYNDSIFWIEVDKIKPNPYQPRKEFDEAQLKSLSDSIRQYGVLQALVVTRNEVTKPDGGLAVEYELIAGERRLRASRLAGLTQVPCLIKTGEENNQMKLELAIIENLQREDLNPVDRAKAFKQLSDEFGMTHAKIAEKVGKSREYVSNTLRLLNLPEVCLRALAEGKISEGHTRPLLMLSDKPAEQMTLFKEILYKKITVRDAELISRKVAHERSRKKDAAPDPTLMEFEEKLSESFGTRVHIEKKPNGGQIMIDFFSEDDLKMIIGLINTEQKKSKDEMMNRFIEKGGQSVFTSNVTEEVRVPQAMQEVIGQKSSSVQNSTPSENEQQNPILVKEESKPEKKEEETFSLDNFTI